MILVEFKGKSHSRQALNLSNWPEQERWKGRKKPCPLESGMEVWHRATQQKDSTLASENSEEAY